MNTIFPNIYHLIKPLISLNISNSLILEPGACQREEATEADRRKRREKANISKHCKLQQRQQSPIRSMDSSAVIRSSHCTLPLSLYLRLNCEYCVQANASSASVCVFFIFFISDLRVLPFPVWFFIFEERKCFRLSGTCTFFFCKFRCYSVFSQRVKASCFECL